MRSAASGSAPREAYRGGTAGIVSRALAGAVDALVVAGAGVLVHGGVGCVRLIVSGPPFRFPDYPAWLTGVYGWALAVLYLAGGWATAGYTVGNRLLGLRVTGRTGRPLGVARALLRAALCVAFPLGLLWVPLSRRDASVQDLLLASAVHYDWR
ncbi:RDD family protein [Streptomyces sp. NPDC059785]|uniref:RDD family protein n=1 Tax=unclassified Streptomyces TaxID=2593676 RepID=UPI00364D6BC7